MSILSYFSKASKAPSTPVARKRRPLQIAHAPAKRAAAGAPTPMTQELGELVRRDAELLRREGWSALVRSGRGRGNFALLHNVKHPAHRLLRGLGPAGRIAVGEGH